MWYACIAALALIFDQVVKYLVTAKIPLETGIVELIPGIIHATNYRNYGAAFGILSGARWFFVLLCVVFTIVVIYILSRGIISGKLAKLSLVMVLAGALGNCIDRVINGFVVDMFETEFINFAIFNVADIWITCGGIVFALCVVLHKDKPEVETAQAEDFEEPLVRRRDDAAAVATAKSAKAAARAEAEAQAQREAEAKARAVAENAAAKAEYEDRLTARERADEQAIENARRAAAAAAAERARIEAEKAAAPDFVDYGHTTEGKHAPAEEEEFDLDELLNEYL